MTEKTEQDIDAESARLIDAAMGGLTSHELLIKRSLEEASNIDARQAAIKKNRERAQRLLAEIDKAMDKTDPASQKEA